MVSAVTGMLKPLCSSGLAGMYTKGMQGMCDQGLVSPGQMGSCAAVWAVFLHHLQWLHSSVAPVFGWGYIC